MGIFWEDLGIVSTTEPVNMEDIKQLHVSKAVLYVINRRNVQQKVILIKLGISEL
jgi:hypothetical protein